MEIVTKNLKKTDIQKRMTIPSKSLHRFPPLSGKQTVDFQVRDESGFVWKFRIYTRQKHEDKGHKCKKYPKPVLTKGWREFVCKKKLDVGDRVRFYCEEEQTGSVLYRVEVERAVKIFGAILAHKTPC